MPELKKQPSCSLVNEWINISYQVTKETNASQWKKSIWKDYTLYDSESESCSVMSDSLQLHGLYSPWNSQGQNTGVGNFLFPSPEDLPNPGIEARSPTLQEPAWKPKNTGVGSLSLFQQIFPTQELNQGLLHCRSILYQLSYEGRCVKGRLL